MTRRLLRFPLLAVLLGISLIAARPDEARARTSFSVSVSYFYDDLAPYGRWVDYNSYGWCWAPARVSHGWRPYSNGYWAYTDYGWTWVSDEPWAWAAYHYGRWVDDPYYGWLWVPGTTWGPAWVAWRESEDYCGWAPLPPGNVASFTFTSYSSSHIPADYWCFVPTRNLCDRDVRYRIRPASNNVVLFRRTRDATRFLMRGGRTVNAGVSRSFIERRSGRPVRELRVVDARSSSRGHGRFVGKDQVAFYRPSVSRSRDAAPRLEQRLTPRRGTQEPRRQRDQMQGNRDTRPWGRSQVEQPRPRVEQRASERQQWRGRQRSNDEAYRQRELPQREAPQRQWREQPESRRQRSQEVDRSANRGNPQADRSPRWGRQTREPKPDVREQPPQQGQRDRSDVSRNRDPNPSKGKKQQKEEHWSGD